MMLKINQIIAKSILTPSKLPASDFVVNPYSGCQFGCVYCYADFMRKFTGHFEDSWGGYVDVKVNSVNLIKREIEVLIRKIQKVQNNKSLKWKDSVRPTIFFSSVTDPYQPVEIKYRLTRSCLEAIFDSGLDCNISILTKSNLVIKDIDLFRKFKHLEIGLTITSTDDEIGRMFEVTAPNISLRLNALKELNNAGIDTYAFVGPLLPHFVMKEGLLEELLNNIKETGTKKVWFEHINLRGRKKSRLVTLVGEKLEKEDLQRYIESQSLVYKQELAKKLSQLVKKFRLEIVGGEVIDHKPI